MNYITASNNFGYKLRSDSAVELYLSISLPVLSLFYALNHVYRPTKQIYDIQHKL